MSDSTLKNLREETRRNWVSNSAGELPPEQIRIGCLLRIADAAEKMSNSYAALLQERDAAVRRAENYRLEAHSLRRSVAALRGVVTRVKRGRL